VRLFLMEKPHATDGMGYTKAVFALAELGGRGAAAFGVGEGEAGEQEAAGAARLEKSNDQAVRELPVKVKVPAMGTFTEPRLVRGSDTL